MDWIEAIPSDNFNNKYLLSYLFELFKIKLPKDYLESIIEVVKNSKIYIFENNINNIENETFKDCKSLTNVIIPNKSLDLPDYKYKKSKDFLYL